ncbi:hypothetical protein BDV93DRAFT_495511 [Ceratobasidium sp. AG-I]|nr:hypothetical protein BDV93DRAFT_495511 [Ceratobasidium sp. AG-I]
METAFDLPLNEADPTLNYLKAVLLEREDCAVLKELDVLRNLGWQSDNMHSHFKKQRHTADQQNEAADKKWIGLMRSSMAYMDRIGRFVHTSRFLDLGCCPGGYSTHILQTCPEATGIGISLPVKDGGHGLAIPAELLSRIDVHFADVTSFDLAPALPKPSPLTSWAFGFSSFDLVVCDGHSLRLNPDNVARPWNHTRLLITQILLGLRTVSDSGTMFVKLSHLEQPIAARLLLALCRVSNNVRTLKPTTLHANRSTFYVVAKGIRTSSPEFQGLVAGLEKLWYIMSFEGETGHGRDITWEEHECITPWEDVMSPKGLSKTARFGNRIWQIQRDALRRSLERQGVSTQLE